MRKEVDPKGPGRRKIDKEKEILSILFVHVGMYSQIRDWIKSKSYSRALRASELEKSIQTYHEILNFSKESLSIARNPSICIISLTVETHKAKEGGTFDFQNREINCLSAERKK